MVTYGEAYISLAEEFELPVAGVKNVSLRQLDHGLRDKSPRGAGAAQITARDLTNLVIPLVCGIGPKEAPHVTYAIGDLDLEGAELWSVDSAIGVLNGEFPTQFSSDQILHLKSDNILQALAGGKVSPLLRHLPIAAKFGDTFAAILEKLAGPDDPLLEFLEVEIFPTRPAAGIRVRVGNSKDPSQSFFYEVGFTCAEEKRSKRRDRAINKIPKELLVDLAKLIARPKD